MGQRDDCREEIEELQKELSQFHPETSDPNDIRLAAQSLSFRYYTIVTLADKIDAGLDTLVMDLLERAERIIPPNSDPCFAEAIREFIRETTKLPEQVVRGMTDDELELFE